MVAFGRASAIYAFDTTRQTVVYTNAGTLSSWMEFSYSSGGGLTIKNNTSGSSLSVLVFYWS